MTTLNHPLVMLARVEAKLAELEAATPATRRRREALITALYRQRNDLRKAAQDEPSSVRQRR
jgi:hypothetical protein